jgi:hypothetical protein
VLEGWSQDLKVETAACPEFDPKLDLLVSGNDILSTGVAVSLPLNKERINGNDIDLFSNFDGGGRHART